MGRQMSEQLCEGTRISLKKRLLRKSQPSIEQPTHSIKVTALRSISPLLLLWWQQPAAALITMGYLSTRALNGLKAYEYKPGGYTWLDNIHRPWLDCK